MSQTLVLNESFTRGATRISGQHRGARPFHTARPLSQTGPTLIVERDCSIRAGNCAIRARSFVSICDGG